MLALTKKEILDELKRLGIDIPSELHCYFRQYKEYCLLNHLNHLEFN